MYEARNVITFSLPRVQKSIQSLIHLLWIAIWSVHNSEEHHAVAPNLPSHPQMMNAKTYARFSFCPGNHFQKFVRELLTALAQK